MLAFYNMTKNPTTYQVTEKLFWIASLLHHKNTQLTFNIHMMVMHKTWLDPYFLKNK